MNDFQLYMGKVLFEYQMSKQGKGDAHPKEIIEGLRGTVKAMEYDYGKNGEKAKPCQHCNSGSYYCDCRK